MTERSVQIWFQNRRAKIKNLVKKSIENGEDSNEIPESMRRYLAMQAMETGKPLGRDFMLPRFGSSNLALGAFDSPSNKVGMYFYCRHRHRLLLKFLLPTNSSQSSIILPVAL